MDDDVTVGDGVTGDDGATEGDGVTEQPRAAPVGDDGAPVVDDAPAGARVTQGAGEDGDANGSPVCPACGERAAPGARFCEACGADLPGAPARGPVAIGRPVDSLGVALAAGTAEEAGAAPRVAPAAAPSGHVTPEGGVAAAEAPCRECGGAVGADGYCTTCGAKAPGPRDRVAEQPQAWVAALTDRGLRRRRNEDAFAVAADAAPGSRAVLVVCDGVATSSDSDVASRAAAEAARAVLVGSHARGAGTEAAREAAIGARLRAAADAAATAVAAATSPDHGASPPSCTFVAAVVERGLVVAGSVGDSRAYWIPDGAQARALTTDDSLAAQLVAAGMAPAAAESAGHSHAITRWLGVDSPDHEPRLTSVVVDGPGWVVVCSDGLWNYAPAPDDLAAALARAVAAVGSDPGAVTAALVDWANEQGGRDNITVALARLAGP